MDVQSSFQVEMCENVYEQMRAMNRQQGTLPEHIMVQKDLDLFLKIATTHLAAAQNTV